MSWLVAPRCTKGTASAGTVRVSARTRGTTGFAAATASQPSWSMSKRSTAWQAARIAAAASAGTRPVALSASARPDSTSSIAASQARSEVASAIAAVVKLGPERRSEGKEDGLAGALEADVEVVDLTLGAGYQGGPAVGIDKPEDRVGLVRRRLLGEVDPGGDVAQEAAGEHGQLEGRGAVGAG